LICYIIYRNGIYLIYESATDGQILADLSMVVFTNTSRSELPLLAQSRPSSPASLSAPCHERTKSSKKKG
ncbi:TPA: hypothetical protein ACG5WT_004619, partial [Escherichia coli]